MKEIRAFVGHSFLDDDAKVVDKFLKYFDQVADLHSQFSWEHAERAVPKILATKVMELMADKNVFIGICTKNEYAIQSSFLKKIRFLRGLVTAKEQHFLWKTSDWIIQEIGFALGKDLALVLLIEDGVRPPGGLQANIEHIPFDRKNPDKSFGKILEMISALSPKAASASIATADTKSTPEKEQMDIKTPPDEDIGSPQPNWRRRDFELALSRKILHDDSEGVKNIYDSYLTIDEAGHTDKKESWIAFPEYARLILGKQGNLSKLKALAKKYPDNSQILNYLAVVYRNYKDYAKSANAYEAAALNEKDDAKRLRSMGKAAEAYALSKDSESRDRIISQMKTRVEESKKGELILLGALQETAKITKEDDVHLAIMERLLQIDPSDIKTRFHLALTHSNIGHTDLALMHYLRIPINERDSAAWNNLGVEFETHSLPAKSVSAYRNAESMDETLAMSNLAQKFINAGFLDEAEAQCDKALAIGDVHENVGSSLARVKKTPEEEDNKEAEIVGTALPMSEFYADLGRAITQTEPTEIGSKWEGPDCVLSVTVDGSSFRAIGVYEKPSPAAFANALRGLKGGIFGESESVKIEVEYNGTLRGGAIEARVSRTDEDEAPIVNSLLGSLKDEVPVLMFFSDDRSELKVLERPKSGRSRFYSLKRQDSDT